MVLAESEEVARLAALDSYSILDTPSEVAFDDLALLAAAICGVDTALVSFVSRDRQWAKAHCGFALQNIPRAQSFCANTIESRQALVVEDALQDERFRHNELVVGEMELRFYAGAPMVERHGHVLGAVCVLDRLPHQLSAQQVGALQVIARQAVCLLEQRSAAMEVRDLLEEMRYAHGLAEQQRQHCALALEASGFGGWSYERATDTLRCDARAAELLGLPESTTGVENLLARVVEPDREVAARIFAAPASEMPEVVTFQIADEAGTTRAVRCRIKTAVGPDGPSVLLGVVEPF